MKRVRAFAGVFLLFCFAACQNLEALTETMQKHEGPLNPKEFNMVLIMKGTENKVDLGKHDVVVLGEKPVHQNDIIAHTITHHQANGGSFNHAYIMSHDQNVHRMNRPLMLEMREQFGGRRPFFFRRNRQDLMNLKHDSLESCINAHDIENKFHTIEDKFHISAGAKQIILSKEQFVSSKLADFFQDICKMLEVSKNQARNPGLERNLVVHEIKDFGELAKGEHKDIVTSTLKEAVTKSMENAAKVYGENLVNLIGVQFNHNEEAGAGSHRVLAEVVAESVKASNEVNATLSIKYNFSYAFMLLVLLVCVSLFKMEVFRDSLVYSNFITTRKGD